MFADVEIVAGTSTSKQTKVKHTATTAPSLAETRTQARPRPRPRFALWAAWSSGREKESIVTSFEDHILFKKEGREGKGSGRNGLYRVGYGVKGARKR
jgi:hypothetical protein